MVDTSRPLKDDCYVLKYSFQPSSNMTIKSTINIIVRTPSMLLFYTPYAKENHQIDATLEAVQGLKNTTELTFNMYVL